MADAAEVKADKSEKTENMNVLINYIRAGFPLLNIISAEEARAERDIVEACKKCNRTPTIWSATEGFLNANGTVLNNVEDPIDALMEIIKNKKEGQVYVFRDLHPYFSGNGPGASKVVRYLRDIAREFKQQFRTLIILSSINKIPPELERDITLVEFTLPDERVLDDVFTTVYKGNKDAIVKNLGEVNDDERERIVQASKGLTTVEAENAIAKAIIDAFAYKSKESKPTISSLVMKEKALAVKKSGILEYYPAKETLEDVGGLSNLKKWLSVRRGAFTKKAREYGLPMPRGVMFVGVPGCGKSLAAKAVANALGLPLIRFDISKVFGGLVGMSEANMRNALQTIDAIGNSVVWMDELEKGLAGMGSSGTTDSGVSARIFGMFLTWMQEKTTPSFIVATINRIEGLPPELLRKGRFDEIFYVGLPSDKEREDIIKIHLKKKNRNPDRFQLKDCIKQSQGFSGAEIEEAIVSGMFNAFSKDAEVNEFHIQNAMMKTNPLSKTRAREIEEMAKWAKENAQPASIIEVEEKGGRKLSVPEVEEELGMNNE